MILDKGIHMTSYVIEKISHWKAKQIKQKTCSGGKHAL